jgi:hypothetical protein
MRSMRGYGFLYRGGVMLDEFKFKALREALREVLKPEPNTTVLVFLHDKWRGYDEIMLANFDGSKFYHQNGIEIRAQFVAGWLPLPLKIIYGVSDGILPSSHSINTRTCACVQASGCSP